MASSNPKLLMSGQNATLTATKVLRTAQPVRVAGAGGVTEMRPGVIWGETKILVTPNDGKGAVIFLDGLDLYEQDRSAFLQSEFLDSLARGAARALPMAELAKIEMEFLQGIFVPGGIGLVVSLAKVGLFAAANKQRLETAYASATALSEYVGEFKSRYPRLYAKVKETAWGALTFESFIKSVSAEDIAFLVGRILRGYFFDGNYLPKLKIPRGTQLPLDLAWLRAPRVSVPRKVIAWCTDQFRLYGKKAGNHSVTFIVAECLILVGVLHSLAIASRAVSHAAKSIRTGGSVALRRTDRAWDVQARLGEIGIHINSAELEEIKSELRHYDDTAEFLTLGILRVVTFDTDMRPLLSYWQQMTG
jgi:hypothetical protein